MDQRTIADEFELQLSLMTKAEYMILVAAIELAVAGSHSMWRRLSIDLRGPAPKLLVTAYDDKITMRLANLEWVG